LSRSVVESRTVVLPRSLNARRAFRAIGIAALGCASLPCARLRVGGIAAAIAAAASAPSTAAARTFTGGTLLCALPLWIAGLLIAAGCLI
jgi:hypothetical protein